MAPGASTRCWTREVPDALGGVDLSQDFEAYFEDEPCEYLDPELYDPDEETLPPGEMELIFENSYIM